jgi:hypothetical protein
MQVIGVAEPDTSALETAIESSLMRHHQYEDGIGQQLLKIGRIFQYTVAWGASAMRYRNLLYRRYQHVPLVDFFSFERTQRSWTTNLFAGYPAFASVFYLRLRPPFRERFGRQLWYQVVSHWVRLHLNIYGFLQQMDVIPASQILPSWRFFIPFSSVSPIPAPPLPTDFTAPELLKWVGRLAINAAPLVTLALCQQVWLRLRAAIWLAMRDRLPQPHNKRPSPTRSYTVPPPPEEISNINATESTPAPQPDTSRPQEEGVTLPEGPLRRQSIISSNGVATATTGGATADFYPSDDEENTGAEMVSRTLISFDVEASESVDPPPGVWSAELRANFADSQQQPPNTYRGAGRTPLYRDNALTRLPAMMAAEFLSALPARLLNAPSEAIIHRWFVRSVMASRGMGTGEMYGVFEMLPWRAVANFVGLELVHLLVQGEIWAGMYQIASWCRISEEEWKEMDEEDERERLMNEANGGHGGHGS